MGLYQGLRDSEFTPEARKKRMNDSKMQKDIDAGQKKRASVASQTELCESDGEAKPRDQKQNTTSARQPQAASAAAIIRILIEQCSADAAAEVRPGYGFEPLQTARPMTRWRCCRRAAAAARGRSSMLPMV